MFDTNDSLWLIVDNTLETLAREITNTGRGDHDARDAAESATDTLHEIGVRFRTTEPNREGMLAMLVEIAAAHATFLSDASR